ncbi:MAG: SHOCT domain-containing protein [Limisphaerales bacterium]
MRYPFRIVVAASVVAYGLAVAGCGSSKPTPVSSKSAGEQLLELNEAKEKGLISDREYERMRKNIVRSND